jgi:hypothetical protein
VAFPGLSPNKSLTFYVFDSTGLASGKLSEDPVQRSEVFSPEGGWERPSPGTPGSFQSSTRVTDPPGTLNFVLPIRYHNSALLLENWFYLRGCGILFHADLHAAILARRPLHIRLGTQCRTSPSPPLPLFPRFPSF